jgi:hypothetical protein
MDSPSTLYGTSASIKIMSTHPNLNPNKCAATQLVLLESRFCPQAPSSGRPRRNGERGSSHIKAILWILALVAFIYVTAKVIPALINEFEFQDGVQTIARFATATRQTPEQIRAAILKEAEKDDVPIEANDVKVQAVNGNVKIKVDYSVTVDLTVYQWTLNFHPSISNDSLT